MKISDSIAQAEGMLNLRIWCILLFTKEHKQAETFKLTTECDIAV